MAKFDHRDLQPRSARMRSGMMNQTKPTDVQHYTDMMHYWWTRVHGENGRRAGARFRSSPVGEDSVQTRFKTSFPAISTHTIIERRPANIDLQTTKVPGARLWVAILISETPMLALGSPITPEFAAKSTRVVSKGSVSIKR